MKCLFISNSFFSSGKTSVTYSIKNTVNTKCLFNETLQKRNMSILSRYVFQQDLLKMKKKPLITNVRTPLISTYKPPDLTPKFPKSFQKKLRAQKHKDSIRQRLGGICLIF